MSILQDVKKTLGVDPSFTDFDVDIKMHLNSALMELNMLGVGPSNPALVVTGQEPWSIITQGRTDIEVLKSYVYTQTRLLFDPPATSYAIQALERQRDRYGFLLEIKRKDSGQNG